MTTIDPRAAWLAAPLVAWIVTWIVRRIWPHAWERFSAAGPVAASASKMWQALPPVLLATTLASVSVGIDPTDLALSAFAATAAPVWHELIKAGTARVPWLPTYYGGAWPAAGGAPQPEPVSPDPVAVVALVAPSEAPHPHEPTDPGTGKPDP